MDPQAKTTRMSDEQIVSQFVERLHEEYTKTEVEQPVVATNQSDYGSSNHSRTQVVAPWDGESPLKDSEFIRVCYRELSATSISFWIGHPPTSPFFVVVFETNDETAFLKARVSDAKLDMTMDSESYIVSVEFDGRVVLDFMPSLVAG